MKIWIPPQQESSKKYLKWVTKTAFVLGMLFLVSFFYEEYQTAERARLSAVKVLEDINVHNAKVDEHNAKVDIEKSQKRIVKKIIIEKNNEPVGSGNAPQLPSGSSDDAVASIPSMPPPPKKVYKTIEVEEKSEAAEKQSKIEIDAGLVKVAMSNESSWMAIFKIVFTVLFTFFGIRLINFGFKKLEGELKPA